MLCTVQVVLDTQRMLAFLRVSQVLLLNDGIETPGAGASCCLLERETSVETSEETSREK